MMYNNIQVSRAHVQGLKQLVLSAVTTKITRHQDSGITAVNKFIQIVISCKEKRKTPLSLTLGTRHEHYTSYDYIGHAYQPFQAQDHVLSYTSTHKFIKCTGYEL